MRYYLRLCIAVTRRHPVYTYTALVLLHVHIYIHQKALRVRELPFTGRVIFPGVHEYRIHRKMCNTLYVYVVYEFSFSVNFFCLPKATTHSGKVHVQVILYSSKVYYSTLLSHLRVRTFNWERSVFTVYTHLHVQ